MRAFRGHCLYANPIPWTCTRCRGTTRRASPGATSFSTRAPQHKARQSAFRPLTLGALAAAGLGAGSIAAGTEDVKEKAQYATAAVQRTGRVLKTLATNIQDYRKILKEQDHNSEEWSARLKACHKRCAERTLQAMERNGSIFIKLGQHLSSMGYLLPLEWTTTFIPLQDHCPVSSFDSIERMFLKDTGSSVFELFDTFDEKPIGAASLAQVHLATMKETGQKVAVKVQHPALDDWVPLDLSLTRFTFSQLKRFFPQYDLEWLSDEMELSLPQELDFNIEGKNAMITKEHFGKIRDSPLVVPDVMWSKRRILVMEYVSGHRLDDLSFLDANGIDRDEVSAALARTFNEMIFGNTPLHCDPHGGNIAIRKNASRGAHNFDLILYDHGLYRDIPIDLRRSYAKLWLAVIAGNEADMRKYSYDVAGIKDDQFPLFASAITGRDYLTVQKSVVSTRSDEEKEVISDAMGEGLLQQLVQLLGNVPRIILLILKTNDLTRSLDENLQTRQGPLRNFLILAHYCSRTVFHEQLSNIDQSGSRLWPRNWLKLVAALNSYLKIELRLAFYESYLSLRRFLHLPAVSGV